MAMNEKTKSPNKNIAKPLLLSALVFPGLGQFVQGKRLLGLLIMLLLSWAVYIVFSEASKQINEATDRMAQSGVIDIMEIEEESHKIVTNLDTPQFVNASYSIVGLWLFSIVEVFRKTENKKKKPTSNQRSPGNGQNP